MLCPYIWGLHWTKLPEPWQNDSVGFCTRLVEQIGVATSPGAGFGTAGEGYVRFVWVREPEILEAAVANIAECLGR